MEIKLGVPVLESVGPVHSGWVLNAAPPVELLLPSAKFVLGERKSRRTYGSFEHNQSTSVTQCSTPGFHQPFTNYTQVRFEQRPRRCGKFFRATREAHPVVGYGSVFVPLDGQANEEEVVLWPSSSNRRSRGRPGNPEIGTKVQTVGGKESTAELYCARTSRQKGKMIDAEAILTKLFAEATPLEVKLDVGKRPSWSVQRKLLRPGALQLSLQWHLSGLHWVFADPSGILAAISGNEEAQLRCECHDLFENLVPYVEAWRWQKETVDRISASFLRGEEPPDSVVLLQHPPVYTMGTRSSDSYLRFDKDRPPFELHRTERGGEVTYHGPGQLVMYPILNLRHQKMDLHWYLRMLEEVVIRALWSSYSIRASRVDGLTGVWVGDAKVAAIGVRVSRWITYHGLALNVNTDLAPFQNIVPCGIGDRPVGSIKQLIHSMQLSCAEGIRPSEESEHSARHELLKDATTLDRVHQCLLAEFAEVFQMNLIAPSNKGPQCIPHPQAHLRKENGEAC